MAPHPLSPSPTALPPDRERGNLSITTAGLRPPSPGGREGMGEGARG
jgi:hypothetical protein